MNAIITDISLFFHTFCIRAGYLDADAIRRAMGAGISDVEVAEMIAEVDEQSTGKIHYDDFVKYVQEIFSTR